METTYHEKSPWGVTATAARETKPTWPNPVPISPVQAHKSGPKGTAGSGEGYIQKGVGLVQAEGVATGRATANIWRIHQSIWRLGGYLGRYPGYAVDSRYERRLLRRCQCRAWH